MAYGLLGLKPWEFIRYTVREFEEAVAGAHMRYAHALDLVMRHALVTGQWSRSVSFRELTGRKEPLPLDPRVGEEEPTADDLDRIARGRALLAEATMRRAMADQGRVPEGE